MLSIFHAYDIRGVFDKDLDERIAGKVGWAVSKYLSQRFGKKSPEILVGKDNRSSSEILLQSLINGLLFGGANVRVGGLMTTPMFYFLVRYLKTDGGVMVTASHNGPEYNGFKIVRKDSWPVFLGHGLEEIENLLGESPDSFPSLPQPNREDFLSIYLEFLTQKFINLQKIKQEVPIRIVLDNGNGVASLVLEEFLQNISWIQPIKLFWEQDSQFSGRGPNPSIAGALDILCKKVLENKAAFGAAFDADGDRIVFTDEKGTILSGDLLTAWLAERLLRENTGDKIVLPVGTSRTAEEVIRKAGGRVLISRRGNVFMRAKLEEENALFGGERIGHYYFRDFFFSDSGVFTLFTFLRLWLKSGSPALASLFDKYQKYPSSGEINLSIKNIEDAKVAIKKVKEVFGPHAKRMNEIDGFYADLGEWWFSLRLSQTEPVMRLIVEAFNQEIVDSSVKKIQDCIMPETSWTP